MWYFSFGFVLFYAMALWAATKNHIFFFLAECPFNLQLSQTMCLMAKCAGALLSREVNKLAYSRKATNNRTEWCL
jgi:hypothetical protein